MDPAEFQTMAPDELAEYARRYADIHGRSDPDGVEAVAAAYDRFARVRELIDDSPHNHQSDIRAEDGHGLTADMIDSIVKALERM